MGSFHSELRVNRNVCPEQWHGSPDSHPFRGTLEDPQALPGLSLSPRTTAEPGLCVYRLTLMGASRPGEQPNPDRASTDTSQAEPVAQDDS